MNSAPKLSSLTPTDKICLASELDGWIQGATVNVGIGGYVGEFKPNLWKDANNKVRANPLNYSTSYDAIIPLIQKQDIETRRDVYRTLHHDKYQRDNETTVRFTVDIGDFISFTPSQLLDALLVATGKATI